MAGLDPAIHCFVFLTHAMTADGPAQPLTRNALFKAAQRPSGWLSSAQHLRDAAEIILKDQVQCEVPYFRAYEEATQEALSIACASPDGAGVAEINSEPPNYLPAQLLYAFAIENVFKGLIVATYPHLTGEQKISGEIKSHNLIELAKKAGFELAVQEVPILTALSQIADWAGRYPVATKIEKYEAKLPLDDPHTLLDYGAHHLTVRQVFTRAEEKLKATLPNATSPFGAVVVFAPKTS